MVVPGRMPECRNAGDAGCDRTAVSDEGHPFGEGADIGFEAIISCGGGRIELHLSGDICSVGEGWSTVFGGEATDVIAMHVRDYHGVDIIGRKARGFQSRSRASGVQTSVEENNLGARVDDRRRKEKLRSVGWNEG